MPLFDSIGLKESETKNHLNKIKSGHSKLFITYSQSYPYYGQTFKSGNISNQFRKAYRNGKLEEEKKFEMTILNEMKEYLLKKEKEKQSLQEKAQEQNEKPTKTVKKKGVVDMNVFMERLRKMTEAEEAKNAADGDKNEKNSKNLGNQKNLKFTPV